MPGTCTHWLILSIIIIFSSSLTNFAIGQDNTPYKNDIYQNDTQMKIDMSNQIIKDNPLDHNIKYDNNPLKNNYLQFIWEDPKKTWF